MTRIWMTRLATYALLFVLMVSGAFAAQKRLVQEGDNITFRRSALTSKDNVLTMHWSQERRTRAGTYVQTAAKFDADGQGAFVVVFIEQALVEDLLTGCADAAATTCTVTVNSDFQYGQDKEQTSRFLVYHDNSYNPYQHRFVTTATASKFLMGAEELAERGGSASDGTVLFAQAAAQGFKDVVTIAKAAFGNYLRDF